MICKHKWQNTDKRSNIWTCQYCDALYTGHSLPEREWVGLTKNEVETLSYIAEGNTWIAIELAEVKLKEKNT